MFTIQAAKEADMSAYEKIAAGLTDRLNLDMAPVALAFAAAPPPGIATSREVVPSACAFWRSAEKGVFFAEASSHFNCPVGSMVMGFNLPEAVSGELMGLVGKMTECGYISGEEPAKIPVNKKQADGIVYGPLGEFPIAPDAVLLWLKPAQAMIWSEATGNAAWSASAPTSVFGRPACAAIPAAMGGAQPTISFGCVGMRTFTEIGDDRMLAVIPGDRLEAFVEALTATRCVNDAMGAFYESRKHPAS
jgi:uncharacterized protein (DUF169 family)